MRTIRILLLLSVAAVIAGYAASNASALGYEDEPCPPQPQLKVCHPNAEVGKSYSLQIKGKGGCTPNSVRYNVVSGGLPPGLSVSSSTALISGVPTQAGSFQFWLQVTDIPQWQGGLFWCQDAKASQWQFQITVVQGIQILQRQPALTPAQLTVPYSMQFTTTGGTPTWSVSSGALAPGLTLNASSGLLSGTATTPGDYTFKITATSGTSTDTQTYSMAVVQPLKVTKPASFAAEAGMPFSAELTATGGRAPYNWVATGLPSGFALDASTGAITGTPDLPSSSAVKVTVTDALGLTSTLDVDLPVAAQLAIKRGALPKAKVGSPFTARLASLGGVGPFRWAILGPAPGRTLVGHKAARGLPAGIKLDARTGRLSGVPRKGGTYRFRVQVTDKLGAHSSLGLVLKVSG